MNEKIKEIAEQALKTTMLTDAVYRPDGYANAVSKDFADKFAELIILECMMLNHKHFSDEDPYSIDSLYKYHFGVEE